MKLIPIWVFLLLSACSGEQNKTQLGAISDVDTSAVATKAELMPLTPGQIHLYQQGLAEIIPSQQSAKFNAVKSMKFSNQPGLHICGYAAFKTATGQQSELPFYVELRQQITEGTSKDIIHRGQLGTDPSKLSKVNFVCRHHNSS